MVSSGWLNWLHGALQGLWHWPLAEPTQLLLGLLLWSALGFWSLLFGLGCARTIPDSLLLDWPTPTPQRLNSWPLAAALFPALLGLSTLIPQELQTLFRGTLLLSIAVVTLYGQQRSQVEQQREQRLQLLAFANRAADLFRAEGDRRAEEEQQRAGQEQQRALQAALAAEESERRQEQ